MARPWDAAIARLRRRALASAALEGLSRWLIPAGPLAWLFAAGARFSPWLRFFAPEVAIVAALALVGVAVLSVARARRSVGYLAKWIDLESALEDRLASAVEWDALERRDELQQSCIDQLARELGARSRVLKLPRTRPRNLPLTAGALLLLVGAGVVTLRRPAPPLEPDARQAIKLAKPVAAGAQGAAQRLSGEAAPLADPELTVLAADLTSLVQRLDAGSLDRQASLAELERLRGSARALAASRGGPTALQPARAGAHDAVAGLAGALGSGDLNGAARALDEVAASLAAGSLGDDQRAQLATLLAELTTVAGSAHASEAGARLGDAARRLAATDDAGAARALTDAKATLPALEHPLQVAAAAQKAAELTGALERAVGGKLSDGEALSSLSGALGAGASTSPAHPPAPAPPEEGPGPALQLTGVWNGAVMRELFAGGGTAPSDEARRLLVAHERVAEEHFRNDEIPSEYAEAVRAYFAGLHQRGGTWTPNRK
jgi:hypothetical protein